VRVAVISGGRSSEHDVSLASGVAVCEGLRRAGHTVVGVEIERDGLWRHDGETLSLTPARGLLGADVAFPVLHGPFGEDGTIQGLLEHLGVPYVGAGVLASALCLDKVVFKDLMGAAGIPQVAYAAIRETRFRRDPEAVFAELERLRLPLFIKPARLGSSVGIAKVAEVAGLERAIEAALDHDPLVIAEAAAPGLEIECSVIGNDEPLASQPGEIVLARAEAGRFYDYEAKYTPGGMELVLPARISSTARDRVRRLALQTFLRAGVTGLARVDFFVDGDAVLVNELNTIPGFTATSVFARLFEASGLPYEELLERLCRYALERHASERAHSF